MGLLKKLFGEKDFDPGVILVVGLGNPGFKYQNTKHNAGREAVQQIPLDEVVTDWVLAKKFEATLAEGKISGKKTSLLLPETFMNLSGRSIRLFLKYLSVKPQIIVVHDDIDLPLGKIRLSRDRGAGGHNGVSSVIIELGHTNFIRIRLGVGRGENPTTEDVLGPVGPAETADFIKMKNKVGEIVKAIARDGFDRAMNQYN
ncbi:MAG: peptidyl-tRNA hydrolase, family [Patescibacteria group bacterium]|nr:peptidyl-tRNA hydrolase, family [Patescibacteria group bacterium]